jgi:hypothetical protein
MEEVFHHLKYSSGLLLYMIPCECNRRRRICGYQGKERCIKIVGVIDVVDGCAFGGCVDNISVIVGGAVVGRGGSFDNFDVGAFGGGDVKFVTIVVGV